MGIKVLVIANNKGGVGKTTLSEFFCEGFASRLAKRGKRVLGIDLDPQANFSNRYLQMEIKRNNKLFTPPTLPSFDPNEHDGDGRYSSADIYANGSSVEYPTRFENLDIIPADSEKLDLVERVTETDVAAKVHAILAEWIEAAGLEEDGYELIIIDTRPSTGPLTTSAICAATHLLIPAEMQEMSIQGLLGMTAKWSMENYRRPEGKELELVGILANKFIENQTTQRKLYSQIEKHNTLGPYLMPEKMHYWQGYAMATTYDSESLFDLRPSDKHRREVESILDTLEEKIFNA